MAAILAAYAEGSTTRAIGKRFALAHSSVNQLLKRHGIMARRRSPSPEQVAGARAMYEAGQSTLQIATALGFGASTIQRTLRQAGVQLRSR
ncbi:hypothetical protein [Blastococcus sp. TF02-09]|uniref:hypothetical protein n=1 Tax=Blastococcus sp. TF02-09 TaxID=2250576 RepID=UPI0011BF8DAA|nr:hypothetical protein [Blastococcus sp. TF02-9]